MIRETIELAGEILSVILFMAVLILGGMVVIGVIQ